MKTPTRAVQDGNRPNRDVSGPQLASRWFSPDDDIPTVKHRNTRNIVLNVLALCLVLALVASLAGNENMNWPTVGEYFLSPIILDGIGVTIQITAVCMVLGTCLGVIVAVMRMAKAKALSTFAYSFVWFFRATPVLVQLIFWFNLAILYPKLGLGLPFGITFLSVDTNTVMTPFIAAILCLTLNEAAYMAEVIRAGILSVDSGQREAAMALGMNRWNISRIIAPQAMRAIIPPSANQLIQLLKNTSLVSIVGIADLLHSAQLIYAQNYLTMPLLTVAAIWYLLIVSLLNIVQTRLERRFGRGIGTQRVSSKAKKSHKHEVGATTAEGLPS